MSYSLKGHKELDMTEHTHRISQENQGSGKKTISGRERIMHKVEILYKSKLKFSLSMYL